jgi:addiction module RelB/DinJ family antitoxin
MKTLLSVKTDKDTKEEAQELAEELGFSLSAVVNASLKQFVRDREIVVSAIPRMTPYLESLLGAVERDRKERKNIAGPFRTHREMVRYLDSK